MAVNGLGAACTAIALVIIIAEKFLEGAWIIVIFAPLAVLLSNQIRLHYQKIQRAVDKPMNLTKPEYKKPIVIIPVEALNRKTENALKTALLMSDNITALHICTKKDEDENHLRKEWKEKVEDITDIKLCTLHLEIVQSPYRRIYKPIIDFVRKVRNANPDNLIAVIIPELIEPHWYEYLLHNIHAEALRAFLLLERDEHIVVISSSWYLREKK
jgi:hypothetical protein